MEEDFSQLIDTERKGLSNLSQLIVVRHAESVANEQGIYQGQTYDTDLSELGILQAKALAKSAKELGIQRVISSPLKRTYQTALEISRTCNCQIEISDLIIETNHGEWEGKHKTLVSQLYPDIYETWLKTPSKAIFPDGEGFSQMLGRIEYFLDKLDIRDNTLLVTHDNVVRIMVTLANGWTLDEIWTHDIEPAALNFFEANKVNGKTKLKILKLNKNNHLKHLRSDVKSHAL